MKFPPSSKKTKKPILSTDFFGVTPDKLNINPEKLKADLDSELNPPVSDGKIHDFSSFKQPTDLEPLTKKVEENKKDEDKMLNEEVVEKVEEYNPPKELITYVDELIKQGARLKALKWDMDFIKSKERMIRTLDRYHVVGSLTDEEYKKATSFVVENEISDVVAEEDVSHKIKINNKEEPQTAREVYLSHLVDWKNNIRTKKQKYAKVLSGLGVDKQLPDTFEPHELKEAKNKYNETKRKGRDVSADFRLDIFDQVESEHDLVQKKVVESLPNSEKRKISKANEKWTNLSFPNKVALSGLLVLGDSFDFGAVATVGTGAYLGYRTSGISTTSASHSHKKVDGIHKKKIEKIDETKKIEVSEDTLIDNLEKKEVEVNNSLQSEQDEKKKERLSDALSILNNEPKQKIIDVKQVKTPSNPAQIKKIEIDVSSGSFLEDVMRLKSEIIKQYENSTIPTTIKVNVIDRDDLEIVKDFNLYNTLKNESLSGKVGEKFGIDERGNLVYKHLDGSRDLVINKKIDEVLDFTKKDVEEVESDKEIAGLDELETIVSVEPVKEDVLEVPKPVLYHDDFVSVVEENGRRVMIFNNNPIAKEEVFNNVKILVLDDKYQDGDKYKETRGAFTRVFEKITPPEVVGKTPIALPFEGGNIYLVHGVGGNPLEIRVLLNGKEIANGLMNDKLPKISMLNTPGLKGGLFFADTVYERAFKLAKKHLKSLTLN